MCGEGLDGVVCAARDEEEGNEGVAVGDVLEGPEGTVFGVVAGGGEFDGVAAGEVGGFFVDGVGGEEEEVVEDFKEDVAGEGVEGDGGHGAVWSANEWPGRGGDDMEV